MKRAVIILLFIVCAFVLFLIPDEERISRPIVAVGIKSPDFELPEIDLGGKSPSRIWRSTELRGKVVFINFWASWCEECKVEMPSMQRLYEKMQGRPFQMIAILYREDPEKAMAYMKENRFTMPVLLDAGNKISYLYGVTGIPETFIVDKEGVLRKRVIGAGTWDSPEAFDLFEKLL